MVRAVSRLASPPVVVSTRLNQWFNNAAQHVMTALARNWVGLSLYQVSMATHLPEDMVGLVLDQLVSAGRILKFEQSGQSRYGFAKNPYESVVDSGVEALTEALGNAAKFERSRIVSLLREEAGRLSERDAASFRWVALFIEVEADWPD